ncbi:hypothetical protein ABZZ32_002798 [Listeria monocytogenes]
MEDKITAKEFLNRFYKDEALQNKLEKEIKIPPYTNYSNLCLYILEADASDFSSISNVKDAIKQYLEKNEQLFSYSSKMDEDADIVFSVLPKWLDISPNYFSSILNKNTLNTLEKKEQIKKKVKADFKYLKAPPKWLQNPEWKFANGKPLLFIGELDIAPEKNRAKIYVFFNQSDETYHIINQSN